MRPKKEKNYNVIIFVLYSIYLSLCHIHYADLHGSGNEMEGCTHFLVVFLFFLLFFLLMLFRKIYTKDETNNITITLKN